MYDIFCMATGVWFMHCHLEVHTSRGLTMAWVVLDGKLPKQKLPHPPSDLPNCSSWSWIVVRLSFFFFELALIHYFFPVLRGNVLVLIFFPGSKPKSSKYCNIINHELVMESVMKYIHHLMNFSFHTMSGHSCVFSTKSLVWEMMFQCLNDQA